MDDRLRSKKFIAVSVVAVADVFYHLVVRQIVRKAIGFVPVEKILEQYEEAIEEAIKEADAD